ncbi:jg23257 [Pararge aegeria aegeria]|uniref:Jg23257 protein n=1 Tax=Pararge aegeria aegeria TaxID=348720 RepID=A0A8S4QGX6_9NEOP|nr:jg23257 [Pararge aegeria aegeria]
MDYQRKIFARIKFAPQRVKYQTTDFVTALILNHNCRNTDTRHSLMQRAAHLGSSATLYEALDDLGSLLSFWIESAGWSDPAGSRISENTYNGRFQTNKVR